MKIRRPSRARTGPAARRSAVALALAGALAPGGAAAGAAEWSAPRQISAVASPACMQLETNAGGRAVAAWVSRTAGRPAIRASVATPGRRLRPARRISGRGRLAPTGGTCVSASLDRDGNALVAWHGVERVRGRLHAAIVAAEFRNGRWRGARRIGSGSDPVVTNMGPGRWVVAHSSGRATDRGGLRLGLLERRRGRWSRVRPPRSNFVNQKAIAGSPRGVAIVWTEEHDTARVYGASRRGRGRVTRAQPVSGPAVDSINPRVAVDGAGRGTAVWNSVSSPTGGGVAAGTIDVAATAVGGRWGAAHTISGPGAGARYPALAADETGRAIVAWNRFAADSSTVEAAAGSTDGIFGPVEELARNTGGDPDVRPLFPAVAMSAGGRAAVAWDTDNLEVFAALRGPDGSWTRSGDLTRGRFGVSPVIGIGANGGARVAWGSGEGAFATSCDCG